MLVVSRSRLRAHLRTLVGLGMAGAAAKLLGGLLAHMGERLSFSGPFMEMTWFEGMIRYLAWFTGQLERFMEGGGG